MGFLERSPQDVDFTLRSPEFPSALTYSTDLSCMPHLNPIGFLFDSPKHLETLATSGFGLA
jgi:hypothetical protein